MLIRFSCENFSSFRDEIEFSMLAGRSRQHPEHIVSDNKRDGLKILKSAIVYGANASGKSNLVKACQIAAKRDQVIAAKRDQAIAAKVTHPQERKKRM